MPTICHPIRLPKPFTAPQVARAIAELLAAP
jgi:hypothetical protein